MCIFCKIINKEIPCFKVYENDYVLAFLDITEATIGHTLIVPKKHFTDIFELDNEYADKIIEAGVYVAKLLQKKLNCSGVNLLNNNKAAAGQSVFHYHMHVIPRYENDEVNLVLPQHETNGIDQQKVLDKILS